jgi:SNF2 family DNA or RNA helicase
MIKSILNSISVRNQKRGLRLVQLVSLKRITKKGTVLAEVDSHQIVIENFGSSSPIAYCSCPFGGPGHCEHIAAVCYHLKEMETKGFDFGSCNNLSHYKYCKETAKNSFHFGSSENWFEIVISCSFGLENVLLRTIVQTIKKGKNTIDLHNGTIGILPKKFTQTISKLLKFGKISGDRIQISKHHFNLLETIIQELKPVEYKKEITTETKLEITNRKTHLQYYLNTKTFEVPQEVKATLRPYQIEACSWLQYLNHSNYGGILADDMGLGKTLVVLTILSEQYRGNSTSSPLHERSEHSPLQSPYDRESKSKSSAKPNGPVISSSRHPVIVRSTGAPATISSSCSAQSHQRQSLIISPSTLIFNWQNEIKKFTPHLKTYTHYGPNRSSLKELDSSYDLIITSYGLVRREIAQFRNIHFNYIILDESQAIKNPTHNDSKPFKNSKEIIV